MLSGLNTTGHEIGGSLGVAVLVTIATGAIGTAPRPPAWRPASATPSWSPASSRPWPASSPCSSCRPRRASCPSCASPRASPSTRNPMSTSHQAPRRRPAAPTCGRRAQHRPHPRRGRRRPRRGPGREHVRIARRAGVVRATIYVHFPTREALLEAVTSGRSPKSPPSSSRPNPSAVRPRPRSGASCRGVADARALSRARRHQHRRAGPRGAPPSPRRRARRTCATHRTRAGRRPLPGRRPPAWHLAMLLALVHAGSAELRAGRVPEDEAETALVATVLGAVTR